MAHRQEIESLGCGVVVVGQNEDAEQAEEWSTSGSFYCDFIHFCDPSKVFYKAFGFDRSLAGVWGPVSLDFYVKEQMSGTRPKPPQKRPFLKPLCSGTFYAIQNSTKTVGFQASL